MWSLTSRTVLVTRIVALVIGLGTLGNLLTDDAFWDGGSKSVFLLPDITVTVLLLAGAALPAKLAVPVLTAAFGLASGVFLTAVSSYLVRDAFGLGAFAFALTCVVMTVLLAFGGGARPVSASGSPGAYTPAATGPDPARSRVPGSP